MRSTKTTRVVVRHRNNACGGSQRYGSSAVSGMTFVDINHLVMRVSDNCLCAKLSTKDPSSFIDNHEFRPMRKWEASGAGGHIRSTVKTLPRSCGGLASLMWGLWIKLDKDIFKIEETLFCIFVWNIWLGFYITRLNWRYYQVFWD